MASVRDGPIAGDPLAFPLVESIQLIGIVTHAPLFGVQIPPLIKLVPQVIPVSIQNLCDTNGKSVSVAPGPPVSIYQCSTTETRLVLARFSSKAGQRWDVNKTTCNKNNKQNNGNKDSYH